MDEARVTVVKDAASDLENFSLEGGARIIVDDSGNVLRVVKGEPQPGATAVRSDFAVQIRSVIFQLFILRTVGCHIFGWGGLGRSRWRISNVYDILFLIRHNFYFIHKPNFSCNVTP